MNKPSLRIQTTTLWNYPSQNYGRGKQGDQNYPGATPSYIIWNVLARYTKEGQLVVDPMCGSGTTIDVCRDTGRRVLGYDIHPVRSDVYRADARKLPLENQKADFVFVDPPYGDNIEYSDAKDCIGRINAADPGYLTAMGGVIGEIDRVLKSDRYMALYVCDYYHRKKGFIPIGFDLFGILSQRFTPVDIIAVTRHNKTLKMGNYHGAAEEGNFFLRGFNYLFIMKKEQANVQAGR
ncbi:MAG TPA: DNA methyltransferase [Spirochaetota bacterium]|nr:DNA methyltransferase [Spirochaetota bacterium]